jgi:thiol-disulfide isomerase/thioredoxin
MKRYLMLLMLLALVGCTKSRTWTGDATDFTFTSFEGKSVKLSSYAGKPVVVNFWADWCPPCVAELPHFAEVYQARHGQFEMVGIAMTNSNDAEGFVKKNGYNWTFGKSDEACKLYKIEGIPVTVFIARNGTVMDQVVGNMDKATFEAKLAKIL